MKKCLKTYELKIIKEIKKDYKKKSSPKILKSFYKRKRKKQQYGCECYNNLSENEKYELVGYRKICHIMRKNVLL